MSEPDDDEQFESILMLADDGLGVRREMVRVHAPGQCGTLISTCALHNPSDHPLKDAEMIFRQDRFGLIERRCEHGIAHPDPDSVLYILVHDGRIHPSQVTRHGCDGCCAA
jgi:hypothetical protein